MVWLSRIKFLAVAATLLILVSGLARAELATQAEAERVCRNWVSYMTIQEGDWAGSGTPEVTEMRELYAGDTLLARCYSIAPQGHVVVPVLKQLPPVQLYSEESGFDVDEMAGITQLVREQLAQRLRTFRSAYGSLEASQPLPGQPVLGAEHARKWNELVATPEEFAKSAQGMRAAMTEVGPLLTTAWHQGWPYNNRCPDGDGGTCVVGCVATAVAQIMKFHNWPPAGTGSHSYHWAGDYSCGGSSPGAWLQASYSDSYNWLEMPNSCGGGCTQTEIAALAELSYEVGVSVEMNYGVCASGASSYAVLSSLPTYFHYDNAIDLAYRSDYTAQTWFNLIQAEIDAGQPMYYAFRYDASSGHAIVCDGWRVADELNQYHMNYGWGGSYTGWYVIDEIYHTYDPMAEHIIRGIRPAEGGLAACCIGSSCTLLDITDCTAAGGEWFGLVTECDPNRCETWACCTNGFCTITRGVDCLVAGGEFLQGLDSCDPPPCQTGACCLTDGSCEEMTEYNCGLVGGMWHTLGCDPDPCFEAVCCVGETCQILFRDECLAAGGVFLDGSDSCDPNPCVERACCVDQYCSLRSYPACVSMGGTWFADAEVCDDYVCLPDSVNLSGGALIVHAPTGLQYSSDNDYCALYASGLRITNSYEQISRIDPASPEISNVYYVLAAWSEPKTWCQTTFGFGSYDPALLAFGPWGTCNAVYSQTTAGWPGPGEGIQVLTTEQGSRNFEPICWLACYVYAAGQVPLAVYEIDQATGFANCGAMSFPIDCYGALGLLTDGVDCHPAGEAFACCVQTACQILSEAECLAAGGIWIAGNAVCDPSTCSGNVDGERTPATRLLLADAVPSPFWSTTRIGFEVPPSLAASPARLGIYDASGRLVRTLLDRPLPAGPHETSWDGTDEQGRLVEAGAYFYRLTVGGQTVSRRLLYLK